MRNRASPQPDHFEVFQMTEAEAFDEASVGDWYVNYKIDNEIFPLPFFGGENAHKFIATTINQWKRDGISGWSKGLGDP